MGNNTLQSNEMGQHLRAVIKNRDFTLLWISQFASVFCAQTLNFVLAYIIFKETGSSFNVSLMFLFYILPIPILGLFAGIIVDHVSRRKIMIYTNLMQTVIVLFYLLVGSRWYFIFPIIFLYSVVDEFYFPAEAAMLPRLVTKEQLPVANFLFTLASYGSMVVGFSFSGEIIKLFGTQLTFVLASVLLGIATISTYFFQADYIKQKLSFFAGDPFGKMWQEIKANYRFILKNRVLNLTMAILLFFQTSVALLGISAPELGTAVLGYDFLDLGVKLILPIFLGSILGALTVDRFIKVARKKLLLFGLFGGAILLTTMGILGLIPNVHPLFVTILLVLLGFVAAEIMITGQTIIQEETPDEVMGRVMGSQKLLQAILVAVPVLFAGAMIDWIGVIPVIFTLAGFSYLVFVVAYLNRNRNFKKAKVSL